MNVIKPFTDKVTKIRYEVGDTYEGDRKEELIEKGFLLNGTYTREKADMTHTPKEVKDAEVEPTKKRTRRK